MEQNDQERHNKESPEHSVRHPLDIIEEANIGYAQQQSSSDETASKTDRYPEAAQRPGSVVDKYISHEAKESRLHVPSFYDYKNKFAQSRKMAPSEQLQPTHEEKRQHNQEHSSASSDYPPIEELGVDHVSYENKPEYQDYRKRELTEQKRRELYQKDALPEQPRGRSMKNAYTGIDFENEAHDLPEICKKGYKAKIGLPSTLQMKGITNVLICGVGQDKIAAELVKMYISQAYPEKKLHIMTCSDYFLPHISFDHTLTLFVSQNSNEKEVLSCYRKAHALNHTSIVITAGGELETLARRNKTPVLELPRTFSHVTYPTFLFFFLLRLLDAADLIALDEKEFLDTIQSIEQKRDTYKEKGKEFAQQIQGSIPLFHSTRKMEGLSLFWKHMCNLVAQVPAFTHLFTDVNYEGMFGSINSPAPLYAIMFEDEYDYHKIKERMRLTQDYLRKNNQKSIIIKISGKNLLSKLTNMMYLGVYTVAMLAQKQDHTIAQPLQSEDFLYITKN